MKFNLEEYDTVESRIHKFYEDHADGAIVTELASDPNNIGEVALFMASVLIGGILKATGYAMELRDMEMSVGKYGQEYASVNYSSWVENAETSAIGRALANAGYSGNKRASREEMQKGERS